MPSPHAADVTPTARVMLWSNDSPRARMLVRMLRSKGYEVEELYTAAREPIIRSEGSFLSGYPSIAWRFAGAPPAVFGE